MVGTVGQDYAYLPNSKDLLVVKEVNVVLVYPEPETASDRDR